MRRLTILLTMLTFTGIMLAACGSDSGTGPDPGDSDDPETYTMSVNIIPTDAGTISKDPDKDAYEIGDEVLLTAEPANGWALKEWAGEVYGTSPEMTVTVDSDKDITAVFEKKNYDLTVLTDGEGSVIEKIVQAKDYEHGTKVELTAKPDDGWRFVEWRGDLADTTNPVQVTVEDSKNVTAVFEPLFYLAKNGYTVVCPEAEPGQKGILNGEPYGKEYEAVDRSVLDQMIDSNEDITAVCTTQITDMFELLQDQESFNQDISNWDVSNVTDMSYMFYSAESFNQNIGNWDVSRVSDMSFMFTFASSFNQDIGGWDVSNVEDMSHMFRSAYIFDQDIGNWNVSNVTSMSFMFSVAQDFNQNISSWCVENIDSKPSNFDVQSGFSGDTNVQPQWGTCP